MQACSWGVVARATHEWTRQVADDQKADERTDRDVKSGQSGRSRQSIVVDVQAVAGKLLIAESGLCAKFSTPLPPPTAFRRLYRCKAHSSSFMTGKWREDR